jgi:hypothetical protein
MFLQGRFRRIIDLETRLVDFEKTIAQSMDVEECWSKIREGSREFGFQGVRMNLDGQVFEELESRPAKPVWELRISLPDAQYVDFVGDFASQASPVVLPALIHAVEPGIQACSYRGIHQPGAPPDTAGKTITVTRKLRLAASAAAAGSAKGGAD